MISLDDLDFLASDKGTILLGRLANEDLSDANMLKLLTSLRKEINASEAGVALETARLRLKARDKFGDDAAKMFFTRDALEQASDPIIRKYRLDSIVAVSARVTDVCCSIGADALTFAREAEHVLGLDIDPVRVRMAQMNASALGIINAHFQVKDVRQEALSGDIYFYDPARRDSQGKRIYDVEKYQPPLSLINEWKFSSGSVKLSPAVDLQQLKQYWGSVEFISVDGDLKEALLRRYPMESGLRAILFSNGQKYVFEKFPADIPISEPRGWLCEPDPSILRANLVQQLASVMDGTLLDETIAYFTTAKDPRDCSSYIWVRVWKIIDWMPFNLKKLREYLREHHVGRVTVKKRGVPMTPDTLIPQLKLKESGESRTLILTRHAGQMIVMICEDYGHGLPTMNDDDSA